MIITDHGNIKTPVFMPVGTIGAVKTFSPEDLDLFHIVNRTDEAVNIIEDFYKKFMLKPNF